MVRECVGLCGLCQGDKGQECLVTGNLGQRHHKKSSDLLQHFVLHKTAFCQKCTQCSHFISIGKELSAPNYLSTISGIISREECAKQHPKLPFHKLRKSVCWGVFCVWVSECTAHTCQDHSQTPTLSLAARERERPMITSMCFQQTHVVLTLAKTTGAPFYTVLGWKTRTHAIWCFCNSFILGEVTTDVGCLFHLAATAPYRPDDVMFGLQMLWNQCWLLLH